MRLSILDELNKNKNYELDVSTIDVDKEIEVKLNIILNNTSLMGEYDKEKLQKLKSEFPELNFIEDVGFTKQDIEFLELDIIDPDNIENIENNKNNNTKNIDIKKRTELYEKYKKKYDKMLDDEKFLTIEFPDNISKWEFMQQINQKENTKFIKYDDFIEFLKEDYRV